MNLFGDTTIGLAQGWLRGLSSRQNAISENIANIDTPGYRAKEAPFESELRRAFNRSSTTLAATDARHVTAAPSRRDQLGVQQAQLLTSQRRDENTVDIDQEMVKLSGTQMMYQAAASALNTKIAILRNAIRG